jgi:hypothetical protein
MNRLSTPATLWHEGQVNRRRSRANRPRVCYQHLFRYGRKLLVGGLCPGDELIEPGIVSQRLQGLVRSHELCVCVAGLDGMVEMDEGFVAASSLRGQVGQVVPQSKHVLACILASISAYLFNGV